MIPVTRKSAASNVETWL